MARQAVLFMAGEVMTMQQEELAELLDALSLGNERALQLMASTGCEIFGISFDDGNANFQFIISNVFGENAIIDTYSWVDGTFWSKEIVSVDFLKASCAIYTNETKWREDAMYFGTKAIRGARGKPSFSWQVK